MSPTTLAQAPLTDAALEQVIALMRTTRMPHARAVVTDVLATAKAQRWDPTEVIRVLLEAEATGRNRSMRATRRKRAGFPTGKTFDVWDKTLSTLPAATTSFLRTLEWVRRRENLIACGPSGTGKTLLLESLGQQAIDEGMSVSWLSLEDLGALVRRHRIDDRVNKVITRVTSVALVRIDDIGLLPVSGDTAEGFHRVVEASYEKRSLAISSNIHPSGFDELMPKTIASAIVDRWWLVRVVGC
ncbi:ATP-binding protein [Paeniglutamicibacter antarcticus]|uniref:ATP-binding protein n=1 Tax=Arthrobacter terrae TaxID=2935737 RepID=A0A931G7K6_9MICC|nr:ATP-binding protein [Arthrobacter terrae]MBG0741850.1 ATP-binding protein [Arthrobacter terrae]